MHNRIYRHSVWIDVFGIVLVGALVVGGAGYLLYHADDAATGLAVGSTQGMERSTPTQGPRSARRSRSVRGSGGSAARGRSTGPLLSDGAGGGGSSATPFSESWRSEAVPSLTGAPASSGDAPSRGSAPGGSGGAAPRSDGPSDVSSRSGGASGTSTFNGESADRSEGGEWRAEARRLRGEARALSGALRQRDRQSSEEGREASEKRSSAETAASAEEARTSDRDVPNPPNVPIGDHLHWLVVVGILWGAWRIGRGA